MATLIEPHAERIRELWRYYKVGLLNTAFGYGLYALLVYVGLNLYFAQVISQICGVVFNYSMFRRLVFRTSRPRISSYVGAYMVNYLLGLMLLMLANHYMRSPYVAGIVALLVVSVINYFILKVFVFKTSVADQ